MPLVLPPPLGLLVPPSPELSLPAPGTEIPHVWPIEGVQPVSALLLLHQARPAELVKKI